MKKKMSLKLLYKIITIICLVSYIFSFCSIYITLNQNEANYQQLYATLLKEAGFFNSQVSMGQKDDNIKKETPKFYSAKSAVDFAFKSIFENTSYEIFATGGMDIKASVGPIEVPIHLEINQTQIKYDDNNYYVKFLRYETQSNMNQTVGIQRVYSNGKVYKETSKKDSLSFNKNTGIISAVFDNKYKFERDDGFYTYIINSNTIIKEEYFSVNYNFYTGKIESYSASVVLDNKKAMEGYDLLMKKEGDFTELPKFSKLKTNCVINPDGTLAIFTIEQAFTTTQNGGINIKSESVIKIKVISAGKTPSFALPVIEK